jgi:hypothetical protein
MIGTSMRPETSYPWGGRPHPSAGTSLRFQPRRRARHPVDARHGSARWKRRREHRIAGPGMRRGGGCPHRRLWSQPRALRRHVSFGGSRKSLLMKPASDTTWGSRGALAQAGAVQRASASPAKSLPAGYRLDGARSLFLSHGLRWGEANRSMSYCHIAHPARAGPSLRCCRHFATPTAC